MSTLARAAILVDPRVSVGPTVLLMANIVSDARNLFGYLEYKTLRLKY